MVIIADRTVRVTLLAQVSGYLAGLEQASKKTRELSQDSQARLEQQRQAFDALGRTALAVGTLAVAGVALAVARFSEFDAAMSNVKAVTQETSENMERLRDAALEAGGRTVFTATEAANAIEELGKNGLTTAQILGGGLDAALDLAAAGELDLARAASIAAITTKQFGLAGQDIPQIADLLAAGAGKAAGDVEDLAQALAQAGLVAAQTGLSVEETTGVLAAFADAGLLGSDAGTSLRTMLLRLTPQSKEAAAAMRELGINGFDPLSGEFIGLEALAGNLRSSLGDLTTEQRNLALTQIFGQDAIRGANRLYELGADGLRDYIEQTNDSGYAARVAADRLDNLRGDVEKLGGAFDTALIQQGSGINDTLRAITQGLTFIVDAAAEMPPAAINIGLVVGALGLVGGGALTAIPKIADFRESLDALNVSGRRAALAVGTVTAALTVATVIVTAFIAEQAASAGRVDSFRESLNQASGAVTSYTRDLVVARLEERNAFADAEKYGITQRQLTDAVLEGGEALELVQEKLEATGEGLTGNQRRAAVLGSEYGTTSIAIRTTREELESARRELENSDAANQRAAAAADRNQDALAGLEGQAQDTEGAIDDLSSAILNFGKATLDTREANRQFESALDDITESLRENGQTLDISTEEGRANERALDDLAEATLRRSAAVLRETSSQEQATGALQAGRDALIAQLEQFGIVGAEAEAYADRLGLIPSNITTYASINTEVADAAIREFITTYDGKEIRLRLGADSVVVNGRVYGGLRDGFASGGYTGDIGTSTVAGVVHGREFVTNAAATSIPANRAALEYMNAGGNIAGFTGAGFMGATTGTGEVRNIQVDMQVVSGDPYTTGELVKQQLAAKLATIG